MTISITLLFKSVKKFILDDMSTNHENDMNKFGHTHTPHLRIVKDTPPAENRGSVDWPRMTSYSGIGGLSIGILGERAAAMFEATEDFGCLAGVTSGVIMAVCVAAIALKKNQNNDI